MDMTPATNAAILREMGYRAAVRDVSAQCTPGQLTDLAPFILATWLQWSEMHRSHSADYISGYFAFILKLSR